MKPLIIRNKSYHLISNYQNDDLLRNSFNKLTKTTFGFDLEDWYQKGFWQNRYIPYSIFDGKKIVSNVSVNVIDFFVFGEKRTFIQIGTVMSDINFRNQGLNRALMEVVLDEWKDKADLFYLFANDGVINFYPKFGFSRAMEYEYTNNFNSELLASDFKKLNMSETENLDFVYNHINQSSAFSKVSMVGNASLVMFYCTSFMSREVYFSKELETIAVAEFKKDTLYLKDVYSSGNVSLSQIISSLVNKDTKNVVLGFTPNDSSEFVENVLKENDSTLFILNDKTNLFTNHNFRFPLLSRA